MGADVPELAGDPSSPRDEIGNGWALLGEGRLRRAIQGKPQRGVFGAEAREALRVADNQTTLRP